MRPSIMSDGATTSAPASACEARLAHQRFDRQIIHDVALRIDQAVLGHAW